jgi:hypothetical protein
MLAAWMFALGASVASAATEAAAPIKTNEYIVLNYHDITATGQHTPPFDRVGVSEAHFEAHLKRLHERGYHPVSVQDLVDAAAGKKPLPPKAVLLTFDDGYESFYTRAWPLLKKYHYPSVVAVIGTWINGEAKPDVPGYKPLMTWDQVRELDRSGNVEIAHLRPAQRRPVEPAGRQGSRDDDAHLFSCARPLRIRCRIRQADDRRDAQKRRFPDARAGPCAARDGLAVRRI